MMSKEDELSQMSLEQLSELVNAYYNNKNIQYEYDLILTELEHRRDQRYGNR